MISRLCVNRALSILACAAANLHLIILSPVSNTQITISSNGFKPFLLEPRTLPEQTVKLLCFVFCFVSSCCSAVAPKCKSCASETFAPLHLINATSCSIKQRDASPPFSSFQKKNRQQTALAMPGHHALAQTAHSSHLLRPLTTLDHRIQHWSETNSQRRTESRH